jgi:hypothetical protein
MAASTGYARMLRARTRIRTEDRGKENRGQRAEDRWAKGGDASLAEVGGWCTRAGWWWDGGTRNGGTGLTDSRQQADRRSVAYLANRAGSTRPSNQQPCRRHALLASLPNRSGTRGPLILDPRRVCHPDEPALPMRKFIRRSPFYMLPSALLLRSRRILRHPRCHVPTQAQTQAQAPSARVLASAAPPLNVTPYRFRLVGTGQGPYCHVHDTLATATVRCFGNIFMRLCTLWRMSL